MKSLPTGKLYAVTVIVTALFILLTNAGCTEIERRGYSPIPQNSPGAWEIDPFL